MNNEIPKIPASEWEVMEVVWDTPGTSGVDVHERLGETNGWKLKTINSFLGRLVERKMLRAERHGRAFRSWPIIERNQCVRVEGESFLNRIFKGKLTPMLVHFVEEANLSETEPAELEDLIRKKKEEAAK